MRPSIKPELLEEVNAGSRGWAHVQNTALKNTETHFMKGLSYLFGHQRGCLADERDDIALRVMRDSAKLYKADEIFYLRAALKFGDEFRGWVGFENSKNTIDIKA